MIHTYHGQPFIVPDEWLKEHDAKVKAETIDKCAEIMSHIPNLCRICPIDCEWGNEASCKEGWVMFLGENIKEKSNG